MTPTLAGAGRIGPAADPTGTLEICKSSNHGMAGRTFHFSVNGGTPIAITGGSCSGSISMPPGIVTVHEIPTPGTQVKGIQGNRIQTKDLETGTVTAKVVKNTTPADETLLTFINEDAPALGLKICKAAAADSPSLVGQLFSFTENGGPVFSVAAGTVAALVCGPIQHYDLGTIVAVDELPTPFTHVAAIDVSDGRGSNVNLADGTVSATVGSGVTQVTYTNAVNPIPQMGYVEVCKKAGDRFTTGNFDFTITAPDFTSTQTVAPGQCSPAVQVPAGNVTIAEAARFPSIVKKIRIVPKSRLVTKNLINRTVTVTVPVGNSSTATVATFNNVAQTGQVKVCKALAANSGALTGTSFKFVVSSDVDSPKTDTVVAGAAGTTACVFHPIALPLGTAVSITENAVGYVQATGVVVSPASQDRGSAPPTANLTVGSGVTTATFTNTAYGTLEVCKNADDPSTATQTFQFSVNGGAPFSVHAGNCSPPMTVPAGNATVTELGSANFHVVSVAAVGPGSVDRLVSAPTANPATVAVPFGGGENETVVTFTDAVNTGQLKICKASAEPSLQNISFNFLYSYTVNGSTVNGSAAVRPGQCSGVSAGVPVVDANGNPIPISVTELPWPTVQASDIAVTNGTLAASNIPAGTATVNVKTGVTMVTYTNIRTPLGTLQVCSAADDTSTATQTFQFSIDNGAPISVHAGQCTPVMVVLSGTTSVRELDSTNFHIVSVSARGPLGVNRLTSGTTANPATATVPAGDESNATVVTFTNGVDTGRIKVCKASPEPTLQSSTFNISYTYNPGTGVVTTNSPLKPGECSAESAPIPVVDPAGNPINIAVQEGPVTGIDVASIVVDNGTLSETDLVAGTTTAVVKKGVTSVTYTNIPKPRTLQVCKAANDPSTAAKTFHFSVNGGPSFPVDAGYCSSHITLPSAGATATVEEITETNFHLVGIAAVGPAGGDRLTTGPTENPATVSVPFGGVANKTKVTFTNAVATGQLKVCKASAAPELQSVAFDFTYNYDPGTGTVSATPSLAPGECATLSNPIPVVDGNGASIPIAISEAATTGVDVSSIVADNGGALANTNLATGVTTARLTKKGITTVTYTNALKPPRTLVVCKEAADAYTNGTTFEFSVNDGAAISVDAGDCSEPITLPRLNATATVKELAETNYHLTGITATGPGALNRLVTGATDNPATIIVPFGGVANQTTVTFTNAVDTGQLQICKASSDAELSGTSFAFDYADNLSGSIVSGTASLAPGECSTLSTAIPVAGAGGGVFSLHVHESAVTGVDVTDIAVENGTLISPNLAAGTTDVTVKSGVTKVTFTNSVTTVVQDLLDLGGLNLF